MPLRFSIVIPTRERAETLRFTLRTCLAQDFDSYEVVVCDNCGSPATRLLVEEMQSPKIRYVRSDQPLAMSDNWDLAVSNARGEFVLVLGDDDGLMPYTLPEVDGLLRKLGCRLLHWHWIVYGWPTVALPGDANYVRVPMHRTIQEIDGRKQIAEVIKFQSSCASLPMIYNSFIGRELIAQLRERGGRVFGNFYPDVYSGFAFAYLAGRYYSVRAPFSVAGLSGKSNGVATICLQDRHPIAGDFNRLNRTSNLRPHPQAPNLPIWPVPTVDSFLTVRDVLFPGDGEFTLDQRLVATQYLRALPASFDAASRSRALELIRDTFGGDPDLLQWFDELAPQVPGLPESGYCQRPATLGFDGESLHTQVDPSRIADVEAVARFCADLLAYRAGQIEYRMPGDAATVDLHKELKDAHAALAYLRERVVVLEDNVRRSALRYLPARMVRKVLRFCGIGRKSA